MNLIALSLALLPTAMPTPKAEPIAYDFRFEVEARDIATPSARERTEQRLHREAARYCRAETRAAGHPDQAALCTQIVVAAVKERMDQRAEAMMMAQR